MESVLSRFGDATDAPWIVGGLAAILTTLGFVGVFLGLAALDVWSAVIFALLLFLISIPLFRRIARRDEAPWLARTLMLALVAKMAMSMVRLFVFLVVYDGNGDAGMYHQAGTVFARRFRDGTPIHPLPVISSFPKETHWIGDIVGSLYLVTSPSQYAGFIFFSYLCFIGLVLVVRGATLAVPEIDQKRLAYLVLFLPSLMFWPSSIGKEAVMLLCLGLVSYGAGLLLAPRPRFVGLWYFVAGLVVAAFIRPHIALMSVAAIIAAVGVGVVFSSTRAQGVTGAPGSVRSRVVRFVALGGLLLAATVATTRFDERFGGGETTDKTSTLESTLEGTAIGGSAFQPVVIRGPQDVPLGVLSVVFRPLPWEARSFTSLIAAAEAGVLSLIVLLSFRRIARLPRLYLRRPFLVFASVFVLAFSAGFSYMANFGILARQRTQMMPMVLVLVSLAAASPVDRRLRGSATVDDPDRGGIVEVAEPEPVVPLGAEVGV